MSSVKTEEDISISLTSIFMKLVGLWMARNRSEQRVRDITLGYTLIAILFAIWVQSTDMYYSWGDFSVRPLIINSEIYDLYYMDKLSRVNSNCTQRLEWFCICVYIYIFFFVNEVSLSWDNIVVKALRKWIHWLFIGLSFYCMQYVVVNDAIYQDTRSTRSQRGFLSFNFVPEAKIFARRLRQLRKTNCDLF